MRQRSTSLPHGNECPNRLSHTDSDRMNFVKFIYSLQTSCTWIPNVGAICSSDQWIIFFQMPPRKKATPYVILKEFHILPFSHRFTEEALNKVLSVKSAHKIVLWKISGYHVKTQNLGQIELLNSLTEISTLKMKSRSFLVPFKHNFVSLILHSHFKAPQNIKLHH